MSFLTEWLTTIVLFILFAIVIDMLLPSLQHAKVRKNGSQPALDCRHAYADF